MEILNRRHRGKNRRSRLSAGKLGRVGGIVFLLCFVCLVTTAQTSTNSGQVQPNVADLKAVFIYNFAKYVTWPHPNQGPVRIGVIGESPVLPPLEEVCSSAKLRGRDIQLRRFHSPDEIDNCQILFICADQEQQLDRILLRVKNAPVLTIGEVEGLAAKGTLLSFRLVGGHVRFEASMKAIQQSGLQVSSQLLRLAIVVD